VVESDGLLGRCLQHEIDHLDGKTLLESCTPINKVKALREYQEALARGARPGDVE
jgi:peptide deformylase